MSKSKVLVVDDEQEYREVYKHILNKNDYNVISKNNGEQALEYIESNNINLVLLDLVLPGKSGLKILKEIKTKYGDQIEVIMVTGYGSIDSAVEAMKLGAFGFFVKSHDPESLIHELEKANKMISLNQTNEILKSQIDDKKFLLDSNNPKMNKVLKMAKDVANSDVNVMIEGESGVGKEIIAKYIHENSSRKNNFFIPVNCSAYPDNLLESELFGHVKGAFTGANQTKIGQFKKADNGTLFLDEIGEISISTQVKLLRVLETKNVKPVGSDVSEFIDFRLVSATNKNIDKLIKNKKLRKDFKYRINTIKLEIPPLRERKEDLDMLIEFFINKFENELNFKLKRFEDDVFKKLKKYNYPGNIRELKNIIERLVVLSKDGVIKNAHLPNEIMTEDSLYNYSDLSFKKAKQRFEINYFKKKLKENNYNISKTAKKIDLSRRHLTNKINKYNIKTE